MLNCFLFVSFNCPSLFLRSPFFFFVRLALRWSGSPGTQTVTEKENTRVVLVWGGEKKKRWNGKNNGETGEGLRRKMSKCLFMPNWATDEPAAISDNRPSGRRGWDEGEERGWRNEERAVGFQGGTDRGSEDGGSRRENIEDSAEDEGMKGARRREKLKE